MGVINSLQACYECKVAPWALEERGDSVQKASYFKSTFQYFASFFSSFHVTSLREKFKTLCNQIVDIEAASEETKILSEKIAACLHRKNNVWFKGVETTLPAPSACEVKHTIPEDRPIEPIQEGGRFVNYLGEKVWGQFFETLRLLFPGTFTKVTDLKDYSSIIEESHPKARVEAAEVTWLGHATVLLQLANFNMLFDPAFFFVPPCYKRHVPPGIAMEKLPLLDVVAVSHNHDDHCQPKAVEFFSDMQPVGIVPQNFAFYFKERGHELTLDPSWWEKVELTKDGKTVTITSIPAEHGSQKGLSDLNKSHWQGFVVESGLTKIYIAGDTALKPGLFEAIHGKFGEIDLAFLPASPERELGMHLNCEQSLQAFDLLKAKVMVPYHYGAYKQASETIEDPIVKLKGYLELSQYAHLKDKVYIPKIGHAFDPMHIQANEQVESAAV